MSKFIKYPSIKNKNHKDTLTLLRELDNEGFEFDLTEKYDGANIQIRANYLGNDVEILLGI